jgi:hypothetical protein
MNDPRMLKKGIRMTVFDLPSHGRSFPPQDYVPGEHYNSEDRYIEVIATIIKKLGLKKTIVSDVSCWFVSGSDDTTCFLSGLRGIDGWSHMHRGRAPKRGGRSSRYDSGSRMRVSATNCSLSIHV